MTSGKCWCDLTSCGPAAYIWTCRTSHNEILLCEQCCALWRANHAVGGGKLLAPSRIRLLEVG